MIMALILVNFVSNQCNEGVISQKSSIRITVNNQFISAKPPLSPPERRGTEAVCSAVPLWFISPESPRMPEALPKPLTRAKRRTILGRLPTGSRPVLTGAFGRPLRQPLSARLTPRGLLCRGSGNAYFSC